MMDNFHLTIEFVFYIMIVIIIIIYILNIYKEKYHMVEQMNNMKTNVFFEFTTQSGLNLTYSYNNFYLTDKIGYIFLGMLDKNGLYVLKEPNTNLNFILNFNESNTSASNIILHQPNQNNYNSFSISNIFNQTDKNIYFDSVNKVILSNDNMGNIVYLTNQIIGNPVEWNYSLASGEIFDIIYK